MITAHLNFDSSMNSLCNFLESLNSEILYEHDETKKKQFEKLFSNLVEVLDDGKKHRLGFFKEFSESNPIRTLDEEIDRLKIFQLKLVREIYFIFKKGTNIMGFPTPIEYPVHPLEMLMKVQEAINKSSEYFEIEDELRNYLSEYQCCYFCSNKGCHDNCPEDPLPKCKGSWFNRRYCDYFKDERK